MKFVLNLSKDENCRNSIEPECCHYTAASIISMVCQRESAIIAAIVESRRFVRESNGHLEQGPAPTIFFISATDSSRYFSHLSFAYLFQLWPLSIVSFSFLFFLVLFSFFCVVFEDFCNFSPFCLIAIAT